MCSLYRYQQKNISCCTSTNHQVSKCCNNLQETSCVAHCCRQIRVTYSIHSSQHDGMLDSQQLSQRRLQRRYGGSSHFCERVGSRLKIFHDVISASHASLASHASRASVVGVSLESPNPNECVTCLVSQRWPIMTWCLKISPFQHGVMSYPTHPWSLPQLQVASRNRNELQQTHRFTMVPFRGQRENWVESSSQSPMLLLAVLF